MELSKIATEKRNENTLHIDELSTRDMVKLINDEDKKVAEAVEKELDHIAAAIDLIADKLSKGGRLIYTGCGTSGRLGILDAVECPPTYSTDPETFFKSSSPRLASSSAPSTALKMAGYPPAMMPMTVSGSVE